MNQNFLRFCTIGLAFCALSTSAALAQTAPDTPVINSISLTYNSGAGTPTVTLPTVAAHSVEFRVDRKLDLGVSAQASDGLVPAVPGQAAVTFAYRVENRGNDTQGFVINVTDTGNINVADGLTRSATVTTTPGEFYVLVGPNADGTNGTIYNSGNAGDLAVGGHYFVVIVANVPITAIDAQFDDFVVRATVTDAGTDTPVTEDRTLGLMGVNRVFADAASNSARTSGQIDVAFNGQDADETRVEVRAPVITAQKTVVVLTENLPGSTFNCAAGGAATGSPLAAIPGACVEYTITVENTSPSSTSATNVVINDPLPAQVTFAGLSSITYSGAAAGSASTASEPAHNSGTVAATIGTLPAGVTGTFRIRATIK
jgi:uncharacterized repeat protein (TIGR01451 family)